MSSKDKVINIDSKSDKSKTSTDNQVEMNPEGYNQPEIPPGTLGIGDEEFESLTYTNNDINIIQGVHIIGLSNLKWQLQSYSRQVSRCSFFENPFLPAIYPKYEKIPASVKIYSRNMNDRHPKDIQYEHWVHFSI